MDRFADIVLTPIALFSGKPLAVSLALGILGVALALWLGALLPTERRFVGKLRRLATAVRAQRLARGSQESQFAEIDRVFAKSDLALAWRRYRSSIEFEDGDASNYADPADFFSLAYLPGHGYPKWSSTLAGVFLTVGLFFTFVGLSAALLKLAGDGHDSLAPAELKIAVEGILAVSSVKFITSIAGILAYIFWSVIARQQSATQAGAEDFLLEELRALSTYVAPEMLLRRQLRLAEALPQTIAASVGASVAETFAPIRDEIAAMSARIGQANTNVAESAGAAFGSMMQDRIGRHLETFGAQLGATLASLEALPGKFHDAEAGFGGQIGRGADELSASVQRMVAALAQGQDGMATTLAGFEQKIAGIPAALAAASQQSSQDMSAAMRQTLDAAAHTAAEANRASAHTFSARVEEMSATIAAVAASLSQAGQSSGAHMAEGAQKFSQSAENAAARLSQTIDGFTLAVNRLTGRLDQTEKALDGQNRRLTQAGEIVSSASDDLVKAAGAMETAATPLTSATLSFREAMHRFAEASDKIGHISSSGDAIAAHIAGFGAQMTQSLAAFDALPEKIRATETGFGGEIGRSAGELTEAALRMGVGFERSQTALTATLAAFETRIEAMPAALAAASENSSQAFSAKIRQTLEDAASVAAKATNGGADLLGSRVDEIARALTAASERLLQASEASGDHVRTTHGVLATGMAESARLVSDAAENSAALLSQTVETFAGAVRGLSAKLGDVVSGLDAQNARMEKAGLVVSGASSSLAEAAGSVAGAARPLTKASVSLQGAMETFSGAAEQIRALSDSGRQVVETFEKTATSAQTALASQADNFRSVERAVGQTLEGLVCGVQNLGQEITLCIETYDNEIAKSIGSLEAALIDVGDIVETRGRRPAETR